MYPRRRLSAYDMALIKLTADLPLSSQLSTNGHNYRTLLNGICLPPLDALNSEDEFALMAGYGYVNRDEKSDRLKIGYIRIKKTYNNASDYWRMIILGERYPSYNGTFSCSGDSGGPLYQYVNGRAVLIGITHGRSGRNHKCDKINDGVYVCDSVAGSNYSLIDVPDNITCFNKTVDDIVKKTIESRNYYYKAFIISTSLLMTVSAIGLAIGLAINYRTTHPCNNRRVIRWISIGRELMNPS
ncbi:uncharacterized protein LOC128962545 [Oppia nitens]|uniref:uncharacterized protein LOC128962545 n=1 Tax=Oppia nitens TaxID=1686743 RepID=UPI0023DCA024|nr:uncharacterized protein LOC128962545 [Oppia nitens]